MFRNLNRATALFSRQRCRNLSKVSSLASDHYDHNSKTPPWSLDPISSGDGYLIKTEVKESAIEGLGRFSLENIPKGTCIRKVKVVTGSSPDAFESGTVTSVRNVAEAEFAFSQLSDDSEDESTTVASRVSDMCWSSDGVTANFFSPSNYVNHQSGSASNIKAEFDADRTNVKIIATKNIHVGDELFKDYSSFQNPLWLTKYAWEEANQPCTNSLGKMIGPAINRHTNEEEISAYEISYSGPEALVSSYPEIHATIESRGYCVLRYSSDSAVFDDDTLLQQLPYISAAAEMEDTLAYNAVGGNVKRNVVKGGGIIANEVVPFCPPDVEIGPHHELLFTPMKPDRLAFVLLAGESTTTTLFDAKVALDFLHYSPHVDWETKCSLLKRVYCDRLVYRRSFVSPAVQSLDGSDKSSWSVLFGDVSIDEAVQLALEQGYNGHVEGEELLVDFAHPLICPETGALNNNTAADRDLFEEGMIWWESDGSPITDDEHVMLEEAYQQSRIPFWWKNPGDIVLIDNRRIAHGREAYDGGPRKVYQLLGNLP